MELDHTIIRRLAFIKYLYQTAVSQSRAPAPLSCASILTMHDAVELFLQLAAEHLNINAPKDRIFFNDYWGLLNAKLKNSELGQKESMKRLNNARNALKHNGLFPPELVIEACRSGTTNFFEDNTPLVFLVSFGDISLIEFVNPETAREKMSEAQKQILESNAFAALTNIAYAFEEMVLDYEHRKSKRGLSPFHFGQNMRFVGTSNFYLTREQQSLKNFVDHVQGAFADIQDRMKILALGINYRKYTRFKMLTPRILRFIGGGIEAKYSPEQEQNLSIEDAKFCLDFVIESALVLAEFDYSI